MTWDKIPPALLDDLGQLTKANSIEGNKKKNVTIIYTPWSNIKVCARACVYALRGIGGSKLVLSSHTSDRCPDTPVVSAHTYTYTHTTTAPLRKRATWQRAR